MIRDKRVKRIDKRRRRLRVWHIKNNNDAKEWTKETIHICAPKNSYHVCLCLHLLKTAVCLLHTRHSQFTMEMAQQNGLSLTMLRH